MNTPLLCIRDLCVTFNGHRVVDQFCCTLRSGKTLALVGESGSGKSVTAMAILGLLPPTAVVSGHVTFNQTELLGLSSRALRTIRGSKIAMVFQEPMTSLNPVFTIGEQIFEAVRLHRKLSRKGVKAATLAALEEVGLPPDRAGAYPHEFSGGMRQRVMIAMALVCEPELLIADEPTTALDTTTSKQVLGVLIKAIRQRHMSVLFISHDLSLVASFADNICVMQNGVIVESGEASQILGAPAHPYTRALLACRPSLTSRKPRLQTSSDFNI